EAAPRLPAAPPPRPARRQGGGGQGAAAVALAQAPGPAGPVGRVRQARQAARVDERGRLRGAARDVGGAGAVLRRAGAGPAHPAGGAGEAAVGPEALPRAGPGQALRPALAGGDGPEALETDPGDGGAAVEDGARGGEGVARLRDRLQPGAAGDARGGP